jgi:hypothetical protein
MDKSHLMNDQIADISATQPNPSTCRTGEAAGCRASVRPGRAPVASVVPALALIILSFGVEEGSLFGAIIDSFGSGSHRPGAK